MEAWPALVHPIWSTEHTICFEDMEILYTFLVWGTIVRESLEIYLAQGVINKEEGTRLSMAWFPTCELMKEVGSSGTEQSASKALGRLREDRCDPRN